MKINHNHYDTIRFRYARDLDGARGVLAFCVVLLHFGFNSFSTRVSHGLFNGAIFQLCVDAFFILSGFVLTGSIKSSRTTLYTFARKRFFRLAPVFLVTTLLCLIAPASDYAWRFSPLELFAGLPLVGQDPANGPSWSVSWEFYVPVLTFASSTLIPRLGLIERRIMLGTVTIVVAMLDSHVMMANILYLPRAFFGLMMGNLLFNAELFRVVKWRAWMTPALLLAALTIMFTATVFASAALLFPVVIACLVLSGSRNDSRLLCSRPAQWLGLISYTLYMVHTPVLLIGHVLIGHSFEQNALAKLVAILISLILAAALTFAVEIPFINYARRREQSRASV